MTETKIFARQAIEIFQQHIKQLGFTPLVHFELEGCCVLPDGQKLNQHHFDFINHQLKKCGIEGQVVDEYWHNQWEYVSLFAGQTPLKEAKNLNQAMHLLPKLFAKQGIRKTLIQPVVWGGDLGQLAAGSKNIFKPEQRAVHIPNAIQVNVSVLNKQGINLVAEAHFGELLQQCFINTSLENCIIYMPEADAYERLALKSKYGLADELCSPTDISGGHQGSVALYKEHGKHNQPMGVDVLVVDQYQESLVEQQNWRKTARVEHRLGAASRYYCPFTNVAFALANIVDAISLFLADESIENATSGSCKQELPTSMYHDTAGFDAYNLFKSSDWFANRISLSQQAINKNGQCDDLGQQLKRSVLNFYKPRAEIAW